MLTNESLFPDAKSQSAAIPTSSKSLESPALNEHEPKKPTTKRPRPISYASLADSVSDLELSEDEDSERNPFDLIIQTCIAKGNTPRSIMAILNSMIVSFKLDQKLLSVNKVKQRIDELYAKKIGDHNDNTRNLTYLGKFDT